MEVGSWLPLAPYPVPARDPRMIQKGKLTPRRYPHPLYLDPYPALFWVGVQWGVSSDWFVMGSGLSRQK